MVKTCEISKARIKANAFSIFYDNLIMFEKELIIPHILMHKRKFCLIPMCELSDKFVHPIYNKDMSQLLAECQDESHISPFYTQLK
jgi:7,8-dihydro-6-hydroxymethylpterin-pyrophosphokinase